MNKFIIHVENVIDEKQPSTSYLAAKHSKQVEGFTHARKTSAFSVATNWNDTFAPAKKSLLI